jgi:hypothetical protein
VAACKLSKTSESDEWKQAKNQGKSPARVKMRLPFHTEAGLIGFKFIK